jgi:hypothetical protein
MAEASTDTGTLEAPLNVAAGVGAWAGVGNLVGTGVGALVGTGVNPTLVGAKVGAEVGGVGLDVGAPVWAAGVGAWAAAFTTSRAKTRKGLMLLLCKRSDV